MIGALLKLLPLLSLAFDFAKWLFERLDKRVKEIASRPFEMGDDDGTG